MPLIQQPNLTLGQAGLDRSAIVEVAYQQLSETDKEVIDREIKRLAQSSIRNFGVAAATDLISSLGVFLAQQNQRAVDRLQQDMREGRDVFENWR